MYFSTLLPLLTLLPLITPITADSHTGLHPKQRHSIPPHRNLANRGTIAQAVRSSNERDFEDGQRKVLVRRKKRSKCQAPLGVNSTSLHAANQEHRNSSSSSSLPSSSSVVVVTTESQTVASSTSDSDTTTSTSAAPATSTSATSSSSGNTGGSLMSRLFPMGSSTADWTTCPEGSNSMDFTSALNPLSFGKLPSISNSPDGQSALVANYPAGTFKYSASTGHGYSFYSEGQHDNVIVSGAKEVLFSYSIYFQSGFQFNKGGKLPGLYGGTSLDNAKSCSGGRQDGRDECFSARLMWRRDGAGEFYNYYPQANNDNYPGYCSIPPMSVCDPTYGDSIARGSFTFPTGEWITVAQRLKLNDVGVANGEQELFVNGVSTINLSGLTISVSSDTKIYGIMAQTFFGGSDASWASPIDQSAWYKDWSLAVLA